MIGRNFFTTAVTVILCWVPLAEPFLPQAPLRPVAPDFAPQRQQQPISPLLQPPPLRRLVTMSARKQGFFRRFRRNRGRNTEEVQSMEEQMTSKPQLTASRNTRVARFRSYLKRSIFTTSLAASLLLGTPKSAEAVGSKEQSISVRPGMTVEEVERGQTEDRKKVLEEWEQRRLEQTNPREAKRKAKSKKVSAFEDYGDKQKLDDLLDEESALLSDAKRKETEKWAKKMTEGARGVVGGYSDAEPSRSLYIKLGIVFFTPTYGGLLLREFVRRRREARYMEKGLEILRAQKAEYFNITDTTSDADVEDELKGLKNETSSKDGEDDDDEEDLDDEDDGDDDDEDEPVPKRKPPGGPRGDGGGSGGDSGGGDPGYGGPSDDDLDRLNKIFGKS